MAAQNTTQDKKNASKDNNLRKHAGTGAGSFMSAIILMNIIVPPCHMS